MQITRVVLYLAAMCLPPKPPVVAAAPRTLKRDVPLVKKQIGTMEVTEVCAGTMTWGSFVEKEESAHKELDTFVAAGVNFLDTAEIYPVAFNYGKTTETWIGNWLTARIADGTIKREDFYIATKCNPAGVGSPDGKPHDFSAEKLEASARASIERLQSDYIDLYYLHFPSRKGFDVFGWGSYGSPERYKAKTSDGSMADFERQVKNVKHLLDLGLIKNWGLSNENAYGVTMFCIAADKLGVPRPCCIQNDMSLNERSFEGDVAEACHHFGVVGLPYGVLSGGTLTGKYIAGEDTPRSRQNLSPDFQPRYNGPLAVEATKAYAKLAEAWGLTPTELAISWARDRWYNAGVITGTTSPKQVEECLEAFRLETLPEELCAAIDAIHEQYRSPTTTLVNKALLLAAPWVERADECATVA
jgi:aryl-alcohol dehydrogenase-like predicted oxidoreductase